MTCSTGAGPSVYIIKRGVLLIIIPNEHVDTITAMFHLCNKFNRASLIHSTWKGFYLGEKSDTRMDDVRLG